MEDKNKNLNYFGQDYNYEPNTEFGYYFLYLLYLLYH